MRGFRILGFLVGATLVVHGSFAGEVAPANLPKARAELRARLEQIMGAYPSDRPRDPLGVLVESVEDVGQFERRKLSYLSEPRSRVPAYLLVPKAALKPGTTRTFPAVLGLHQTHPAGAKVVVGLGQFPDDEYGVELVRRGFVVLAPSYPWLAGYEPDLSKLGYASGTMKAILDNSRGLDLLTELPYVATNRGFGCIGHSLGGHNGLFTAAFDPRITVVATSCGFDSFRDYYGGDPKVWQPDRGWCQSRYMPRLIEYRGRLDALPFDFPEVLALISPRRVYVSAPKGDSNFRWESVDRVVAKARTLSAQMGVPSSIEVEHPESSHSFPPAQREKAYRALEEVLRPNGP